LYSSLGSRPPAPETVSAGPPFGGVPSLSSLEINAMERAVALARLRRVELDDLPEEIR
jgi:hypothetical protein